MRALYLSADYIGALVEHAAAQGIPAGTLLGASTIPTVLTGLLPWPVMAAAIAAYSAHCPGDSAALRFGLNLGITRHGPLGYAGRSARTPLEAALLDEKYLATRTNIFQFRITGTAAQASLLIDSDLPADAPGWRFLTLTIIGSLARLYADLCGGLALQASVTLPFAVAAPDHPLLAGLHWQDAPASLRVDVDMSLVRASLSSSDEPLKQLLVDQCQAAMPAADRLDNTVAMVRHLLRQQLVDPPPVSHLSAQLGLSERTLKRQLHNAGTSCRAILIELKVESATQYLQTTDLSVEKIAARLGYDSPSTFRNLFRKWTGKTPGEVRGQR